MVNTKDSAQLLMMLLEAFDKTAKILGIDFPGGPQIEILALKETLQIRLPKPIQIKVGVLIFCWFKNSYSKNSKRY